MGLVEGIEFITAVVVYFLFTTVGPSHASLMMHTGWRCQCRCHACSFSVLYCHLLVRMRMTGACEIKDKLIENVFYPV